MINPSPLHVGQTGVAGVGGCGHPTCPCLSSSSITNLLPIRRQVAGFCSSIIAPVLLLSNSHDVHSPPVSRSLPQSGHLSLRTHSARKSGSAIGNTGYFGSPKGLTAATAAKSASTGDRTGGGGRRGALL